MIEFFVKIVNDFNSVTDVWKGPYSTFELNSGIVVPSNIVVCFISILVSPFMHNIETWSHIL